MSKLVEIGSLKFGDWFVAPKGQRGMCLGQTIRLPSGKTGYVPVWVDIVRHGLWAYQEWSAYYNVTPLPDCTGPDWMAPEPRPEIAIDTPVWVRDSGSLEWIKHHFAKWASDGRIVTYGFGLTSHTLSKEFPVLTAWKYYSLTEPNEDPKDK